MERLIRWICASARLVSGRVSLGVQVRVMRVGERPRTFRGRLAANGLLDPPRLPSPTPIRSRHPRQILVVAARLRSSAFRARSETVQAPRGVRAASAQAGLSEMRSSRKTQVGAVPRIAISPEWPEINARRAMRFTKAVGCHARGRNTPCCPREIDADGVSRCGWTRAEPHQLYAASAYFTRGRRSVQLRSALTSTRI